MLSLVIHEWYECYKILQKKYITRVSGLCNFFAMILFFITCISHQNINTLFNYDYCSQFNVSLKLVHVFSSNSGRLMPTNIDDSEITAWWFIHWARLLHKTYLTIKLIIIVHKNSSWYVAHYSNKPENIFAFDTKDPVIFFLFCTVLSKEIFLLNSS